MKYIKKQNLSYTPLQVYKRLSIHLDRYNCKLFYLTGMYFLRQEDWYEVFKEVCSLTNRDVCFITLNNTMDFNILKTKAHIVYVNRVPIGYNNRSQYHCLVKNPNINRYKLGKLDLTNFSFKELEKISSYKTKVWRDKYINKLLGL